MGFQSFDSSALDAAPFSLNGQPTRNTDYLQQRFGATLGGPFRIPKMYSDGGRTFFFLNYSGTHSRTPYDAYATVPTAAARAGDLSGMTALIVDPTTGQPFPGNQIPEPRRDPAALALLDLFPLPNQPGTRQNFHYVTTTTNQVDDVNFRLVHNFGDAAQGPRGGAPARGGGPDGPRGDRPGNLTIAIHYRHSEIGSPNVFSTLGGTSNVQAWDIPVGYSFRTFGLQHSIRFQLNRQRSDASNLFAFSQNIAGLAGVLGASSDPFDWGAPNLSFSTAFTPDDTEFNIFNTDRRLDALRSLSDALSPIEQKKSVVYFSSGMSQSGSDNQVQLRRTVDRAVRANVSIYAADVRGLQAIVPGGQASQASARGRAPFSGASVTDQFGGLASSQDTLTTLAEDTGGRAFFDSNAFGSVFTRVVEDTSAYYLLGFSSTNPARDGRFRRITVRVNRPDVKLEYRSGYYASRDFAHSTRDDRERQLQDQLESDLSATDLSTYVSAAYFRVGDSRYFVPISIVLPGNQLPLTSVSEANKATIDVLGIVRNEQRRPVARIRDTIRLAIDSIDDLKRKTVQYETSFELPPGRYRVKVVVRENTSGTTGSYEAGLVVPDLARDAIKLSSIVVGTQLKAGARRADRNPLVRDGRELVPNVTHVVSTAQHLYFYYEIYDPGRTAEASRRIKVMTSLAFYRGRQRAFETPLVQTTELSAPDRTAAAFQLDVPAASLKPGLYTCQVNVVDDVAGTFAFPRLQLYVRK